LIKILIQSTLFNITLFRSLSIVGACSGNNSIVNFLKQKVREISESPEVNVLNIECDEDHFHMIFRAKPTLDTPKYVNAIKTITSREIRRNYPEINEKLWHYLKI